MNREIKFRGFTKKGQKMLALQKMTAFALDAGLGMGGLFIPFDEDVILMQYTGLKDKNGTEIYEGDFIQDNPQRYWLVIWDNNRAGFYYELCVPVKKNFDGRLGKLTTKVQKYLMDDMTIIGNKYQNPELLNP